MAVSSCVGAYEKVEVFAGMRYSNIAPIRCRCVSSASMILIPPRYQSVSSSCQEDALFWLVWFIICLTSLHSYILNPMVKYRARDAACQGERNMIYLIGNDTGQRMKSHAHCTSTGNMSLRR